MEAATATAPPPARPLAHLRRIDWQLVWTWALGFGSVVYLGLEGGGYDPLVHDRAAIVVWWVLLAGTAAGALPRGRLGAKAWTALGLLAGFVAWTALSLGWTENVERTAADLARVGGYLGLFALAVFSRGPRATRRMVAAVGAGIACVAAVALLSRLHPAWFPEGRQTVEFLTGSRERLAYPLDYWNGVAALIAIGLPLLLHLATEARSTPARVLAAASLPALALTAFLTLSRGGIAAALLVVALYLALAPDRLRRLATALLGASGGAILIAATIQREALHHGLVDAAARQQGDEMLAMVLVVCAGVGLLQAALAGAAPQRLRLARRVPRRWGLAAAGAGALALVALALALGAPSRISHAWSDFKQAGTGPGTGTARLSSASGEGRYQFWESALREARSAPLTGTGSGTFELWWNRDGSVRATVRDTHSLYMQTLGELGLVGFLLLAGFLLAVLATGAAATVRSRSGSRSQMAAALAGVVAFCFVAGFDWIWQIPVLPVAALLLAAALVTADSGRGRRRPRLGPGRIAIAIAAAAAIAATAVPLTAETHLRSSQAEAAAGKPQAAYDEAVRAAAAEPAAAAPRLQQALVLEQAGQLDRAAAAAKAATDRAATDWRPWLVLSRIEAERGRAAASVRAYSRARSLDPRSPLFSR
ncbi:MAG TPA: O-antigen ligase family protein [Solirubrobacterales bacterium]|nr:O-antigen ligase family protein [Solirubrobacterales bacterium]